MTQLKTIKKLLDENGRVSRNHCLRNFVTSRLAARIDNLKAEGYSFKEERIDGDYVYILTGKPSPKQLVLA